MADDFYPFVENGGTPSSDGADIAKPLTSARIAVYDDMVMPPRVVMIDPSDVRSFLAEITKTVYELAYQHCDIWSFQVIRELVENLIHASFLEPTISILDRGKTIVFCDQGPGIPNKQAALKPSFSSATASMKRYIRGVGSGLPIVEEWLRLHHGTLTIEDNLGRGTTVTVSLLQKDEPSQTKNSDNSNVTVVDRQPAPTYPNGWPNPFGQFFGQPQGYPPSYGYQQPFYGFNGTAQNGFPQALPPQDAWQRGAYPQQGYQQGFPSTSFQPGYQQFAYQPPTAGYPAQAYQSAQQMYQQQAYQPSEYPFGGQAPTREAPQEASEQNPYWNRQNEVRFAGTQYQTGSSSHEASGFNPGQQRAFDQDRQTSSYASSQHARPYDDQGNTSDFYSSDGSTMRSSHQEAGAMFQRDERNHPLAQTQAPYRAYADRDQTASPWNQASSQLPVEKTARVEQRSGTGNYYDVPSPETTSSAASPVSSVRQPAPLTTAATPTPATPKQPAGIDAHAPLTRDQKEVMRLYIKNDKIGPKELSTQLGIASATGSRKLKEISTAGYIVKKGQKYVLTGEGQRMLTYLMNGEGSSC